MPSPKTPSTSAERSDRYRGGLKRELSEIRAELATLRRDVVAMLAERQQQPEQCPEGPCR